MDKANWTFSFSCKISIANSLLVISVIVVGIAFSSLQLCNAVMLTMTIVIKNKIKFCFFIVTKFERFYHLFEIVTLFFNVIFHFHILDVWWSAIL